MDDVARLSAWSGQCLIILALFSAELCAGDGRIEINAASAAAGGVTPTDDPGFPVTIDSPGSYILTGDLVVPDADTAAIVTTGGSSVTNRVSIDLNGFQISGPVVCGGAETDCNLTGTGDGIRIGPGGAWSLTVRNGAIIGMGNWAVNSISDVEASDVQAVSNGGGGFYFNGGTVRNSTVRGNGGDGIRSNGAVLVSDSVIVFNKLDGLWCRTCTATRNTVSGNRDDGIEVGFDAATIVGNTIHGNQGFGINAAGESVGYGMNAIDPSIYGGGTVSGTAIQIGVNICDGNTSCP